MGKRKAGGATLEVGDSELQTIMDKNNLHGYIIQHRKDSQYFKNCEILYCIPITYNIVHNYISIKCMNK